MKNKKIENFLSEEYKEFAMYSLESRAIASMVDGLKPVQRKIIYISSKVWKSGLEKPLKIFQLAGKVASDCMYHHGDCLDFSTEILLTDGTYITIGDWFENYPNQSFNVTCYDEVRKIFCEGRGHSPRVGNITNDKYEIELESGEIISCTSNHPFLTDRGWVEAKNLIETDNIENFKKENLCRINKINRIKLNKPEKFYDITVDEHHNFIIGKKSMIITHNSSLSSAITSMAQSFKNNAPLLDEDGQFGSLRSPDAGAPRYIGTKLNGNYRKIYRDNNLLDNQIEEGEKIEPKYLLPIIPMILVNGGGGIAVGFKSMILNRDIIDVSKACLNYLKKGKVKNIPPSINGFKGTYENDPEKHKSWIVRGTYQKVNTTTLNITELPPSMTYEKYENILEKLISDGIILSYEDNCKDNINYVIKMSRKDLAELSDIKLIKVFKLEESFHELYNTLDEHGKLLIFENVKDIITYFVDFRLKWYDVRKKNIVSELTSELRVMDNRSKFISLIIKGDIIVNNRKKVDIEKMISKNKLDKIDGSYDYLLRIPIHNLTKENYDKIKENIKLKKIELVEMKKKKPKDIYIEELSDFIKKW